MTLEPIYQEIDNKVSFSLLNTITRGLGNVLTNTLQKMLDNVSSLSPHIVLAIVHQLFLSVMTIFS